MPPEQLQIAEHSGDGCAQVVGQVAHRFLQLLVPLLVLLPLTAKLGQLFAQGMCKPAEPCVPNGDPQ